MKKLLLLLILSFFSAQGLAAGCPDGSEPVKSISDDGTFFVYKCAADSNNAQSKTKTQSSHKLDTPANWPSGIKYASDASANAILYFDEAVKPERLYINSSDRPPHNVAYEGNIETPTSLYGFWPEGAYSIYSPYDGNDYREKFVFEEGIDEIVDGNDHVQRGNDVENKEVFSFHLQKFHNGDKDSLETLKSMMMEWVNGPYWKAMIPDRELACTTCSNEQPIWEGYNFSISSELWNTLIPMLEVHITLIREETYSTNEYDLVHNWLEKRVWLAEQGPAEGQLAAAHRWIPDPGPPNHHKIRKSLGYLMWGVADQNSEYFTAGVRGVEQYYNVLRSDGSITTEHFYDKACQTGFNDHGCRNGLSLGNETGKFYALGAIVMHNQGIDVRKKYPKIEKNIEWTTQVAADPTLAMKWIGNIFVEERAGFHSETWSKEGINMDWAMNWAGIRKNLSHIYLWDTIFQTNYADNLKSVVVIDKGKEKEQQYNHIVRRAFDFGIADTGLITFNPDEVITGFRLNDELESGGKVKITSIVGTVSNPLTGDSAVCRIKECDMGNMIADAMRGAVIDKGYTIALMNSGGIRASLDAGDVTLGEIMTILPFQNTLSTFKVTGEQLLTAIENGVSQVEDVAGRFPQVSGMRYTFDPSKPANGGRVTSIEIDENGSWEPLDLNKTYGMVSNNFIRGGGDGYKVFRSASEIYDFGPDLADVVADYIKANPGYSGYTDNRITQE